MHYLCKYVNKNKKKKNKTVSNIIALKNVKYKTKLYALAQTQKNESKDDLFTFLISKTSKKIGVFNYYVSIKRKEGGPSKCECTWAGSCQCEHLHINFCNWGEHLVHKLITICTRKFGSFIKIPLLLLFVPKITNQLPLFQTIDLN